MRKENSGFSLASLLLGIFYLLAGFIALRNPLASNTYLVILIGIISIIDGAMSLILNNRLNKYFGRGGGLLIFSGIVSIVFGLLILFNLRFSVIAIPLAFAFYLIFNCLISLFRLGPIRKVSTGMFVFLLIINILGILLGLMLIKNPLASFITVANILGIYFLIGGIRNIIHAF